MVNNRFGLAFIHLRTVGFLAGNAKRRGVEWCLGDEAVWCWNSQEAGNTSGYAEEEDVPMKAGGLLQGELTALANEAGDVMVEVEEDRQQDCKPVTPISIPN